jgi:tRNA(adenine34) deaminase
MSSDFQFMGRAIQVALRSEQSGDQPVGAVITLGREVIAEAGASILLPNFDGTRHAEMQALRSVPPDLWDAADEMSIYSTLEPCLMCFSAILIHGIGRIVFGAADEHGGASPVHPHLPPYFQKRLSDTQCIGPLMPEECDPLFERLIASLAEAQKGLI